MDVLIVDDNKNNRMILSLLLEDYSDEHEEISFEIDEAEDGQIAIDKAKAKHYDMIFMDIMMPVMDGIEATRQIKAHNKQTMLIAVSAVDDDEPKKKILSNGAEDYITKPVNSDVFEHRLKNYLTVVESRTKKAKKVQSGDEHEESQLCENLYTKKVYKRVVIFYIDNEDALSEFWEYYLLEEGQKYEHISDYVRALFSVGELQIKMHQPHNIYVEESDSSIYFTMNNINTLGKKIVKLSLSKNKMVNAYKIDEEQNKLTLSLAKTPMTMEPIAPPAVEKAAPVVAPPVIEEEVKVPENVEFAKSISDLQVFTFMDPDDLEEMEQYIGQLSSLLLVVAGSISDEEIAEIYTTLDRIAKILNIYSETYNIGQALQQLSDDISSYSAVFKEQAANLSPMCAAFSNDLSKWVRMVFQEGAPSANFMDDSLITNAKTISNMLNLDSSGDGGQSGEDLDDIFDF